MRENRTYGSEGGEAKSLPYPYRLSSPRHVRGDSEPFSVLPGPAVGVTPVSMLTVRRGVAGSRMDDGKVAEHADLDVLRREIPDPHRQRRLPEKRGTVDKRFVGIGAVKVLRQDFVEAF